MLGDEVMATALLDRLLHHSKIFNLEGPSYRIIHDLRHVYAQTLLDQGVCLEDIQSLLGHEDFKTTQKRYAMFAVLIFRIKQVLWTMLLN